MYHEFPQLSYVVERFFIIPYQVFKTNIFDISQNYSNRTDKKRLKTKRISIYFYLTLKSNHTLFAKIN